MRITEQQKTLLEDFKRYIVVRGYAAGYDRRLAAALRECFAFMNEIGKADIKSISTQDIKTYHTYLEHRPNIRGGTLSEYTISNYIFALKLFFDYALKTAAIEINPMSILHYPKPKSDARRVITRQQISILYRACENEQERAIISLFYGCGLRKTEGHKLNTRDVDFKGALLYVRSGKGSKRRVVPMTEKVRNDLKNYYYNLRSMQMTQLTKADDTRAFMLNRNGTRMRGGSHYTYFKRILQRTALPKNVSLHNLRHSIATHLLDGGMKIEAVRDFLGHACLESTQIYTRVNKNLLR